MQVQQGLRSTPKPRQMTGPVERSIAPIDEGFGEAPQSFSQHVLR